MRLRFAPRAVRVRFVVYKVEQGPGCPQGYSIYHPTNPGQSFILGSDSGPIRSSCSRIQGLLVIHLFARPWSDRGRVAVYCYLLTILYIYVYRDSAASIATRYGVDGPEIESRWGQDFPHPAIPALLYNGYRVFSWG
jgi:hypothetical protein